jgi:hypothetical protein
VKKIIFLLVFIVSCYGCTKDNNEISKFKIGTFYGEKIVHYFGTNYDFVDTITIEFESTKYTYSGSTFPHPPDFGSGNYLIKNNSIEFNDEVARNALYTWDWILVGMYKFRTIDDSIILNQNNSYIQISCRLKKITK